MKVLMINSVCGIRSTGRICTDLADELSNRGHTVKIAYGRESVPDRYQKYAVRIGNKLDVRIHGVKSRLLDNTGFNSKIVTKNFLSWVESFKPDVIHLHNLHGYYINVEMLFEWIKKHNIRVIWTLHDCWAFTGHAAYCEASGCEKWKTGCSECPNISDYPKAYFDNSFNNWKRKKMLFSGVSNLTIVTPSKWLAELTRKSFLSQYPVEVIYNGIDIDAFQDIDTNCVKVHYSIPDKKVILGVASIWDKRKGLEDFIKLNENIDKSQYCIVIVGLSIKQIESLPDDVIGIHHTESIKELAGLYSLAYVFVNPTYEDNYPTTNIEAIACGTPVVTYDTGGSGESAVIYGSVVPKGDINKLYIAIEEYKFTMTQSRSLLGTSEAISQYLSLYERTNTNFTHSSDVNTV